MSPFDAVSQRLNSYFGTSPELRRLSGQARELLALQRHYEQLAPPALARFSHVLQLERQTLTLAAGNGAVAAKLRQLAPELLRQLQDRGCEITEIRVRVQVGLPPAKCHGVPVRLSAAGRRQLIDSAEKMPDSPLKSALRRLAGINK
jgi:hypothetical protein